MSRSNENIRNIRRLSALLLCAQLGLMSVPSGAKALTTSAMKDQTCVGYRTGNTTCSAGEFTVSPVFSAAPGTPPFCIAGGEFSFKVDLGLSGTNTDRQDIGFFVGQQGNDPRATTPGNICSVATFPRTPSPWENNDGDACGDFDGGGNFTTTIDEIKVVCQGDSAGALQIPYVLTYWQNDGNVCTGPANVTNGAPSKCNAGVSSVSGNVAVFSGAYVDVTKQAEPSGDNQSFSFTATGPVGSKVIVLTGATLTPYSASGGTYTPATIAAATNRVTFALRDGQTARVYINALSTNQTLTITEAADPEWESSAAISCSAVNGSPTLFTDPAARSIRASLSQANSAAACTVTNLKRPRIFLLKSVAGRVDPADQFTVSASGGGTLTGTTSATTSGWSTFTGTGFYSSPYQPLTLNDAKATGPTPISGYAARLSCVNLFNGPGATDGASLPNRLFASSHTLTPAPGDYLICSFTNTPRAALTKSYAPGDIAAGDSSALTFTVQNGAGRPAQSDLAFTDTLPAGVTVTGVGPVTGSGCGGTTSFTTSTVSLADGEMNSGTSSCRFSATVRGDLPAAYANTAANIGGEGGGLDTAAVDATLRVFAPPSAAKAFGAATIPPGAPVSLTLSLANPAANAAPITDVAVADAFPAGLVVRDTGFTFAPAGCGSVTRNSGQPSAAGDSQVLFKVASLAPGESCQATIRVSSSATGDLTNTTAPPTAAGPTLLTGTSASATLNVHHLPLISILKSADRASANPGQDVVYTVEVVNTGAGIGNSVVLTDNLSPYASLYLGAGVPFTFADSAPASGLSLGAPQYSDNNGATWSYALSSGAGGAPAGFDGRVTNWRIPMAGTIRPGGSFTLNYRVKVK